VLGLGIAGVTLLTAGPKSARVLFVDSRLVRSPNGSGPAMISYGLANTGNGDAVVTIWDRTYFFSTHPEETEFPFESSSSENVQVPAIANAVVEGEMRFAFEMSAEKLVALNAGKARLFFFARGQYTDESNAMHQLPFSAMYDATFRGNLVAVPQGIVFK
jgi:hypothetical protein